MKDITIQPEAARLIAIALSSCGNDSCDIAIQRLSKVSTPVSLSRFATKDGWLKPVFGNLQAYAIENGIRDLGVQDVTHYLGGKSHINDMVAKVYGPAGGMSSIAYELGKDAGLVLDVLLPLSEDGHYQNNGWDIDLGDYVLADPDDEGVLCYHRGLVVRLPLPPSLVVAILEEQRDHTEFRAAAERLGDRVELPRAHLEAIRLSQNKEATR